MEDFGLFGAVKGLLILAAVIAVPVTIIALGIQYWPITIVLVAAIVLYMRHQRAKNMV